MKKQITTLAAMVLASNVAMAGSLGQVSNLSADSIKSIVQASEILGQGSVNFSKGGVELSKASFAKTLAVSGDAVQSSKNGLSAAAAFSVKSVEFVSAKSAAAGKSSVRIVRVTLEAIKNGTVVAAEFAYDTGKEVGSASYQASKTLFKVGSNVVVATSNAGVVIVTEGINGSQQILSGHISGGSTTLVASFGKAAKTFGSEVVRDLDVQPSAQATGYEN
ncbi:MAG: hypothetical protein RBT63_08130 [Bdellovibrionales bacterium]|jgi:hypothetical protein|nr:hypothetical protein [Bdellovibrionales bacterium]